MNNIGLSLSVHPLPNRDFDIARCKGKNRKRLLVVGMKDEIQQHFDLLSKILRAVGFDIEDDAHLLTVGDDESIALFSSEIVKEYERALLFGLRTTAVGLSMDLQHGIHRLEGITLIAAPPLSRITSDEKLKRGFWQVLKTEFAV